MNIFKIVTIVVISGLNLNAQVATPPASTSSALAAPTIAPNEIICKKDYECMAIPTGCCDEVYQALNRAFVLGAKQRVRMYCRAQEKTNANLCKGSKARLFPPKTVCKEQKCLIAK